MPPAIPTATAANEGDVATRCGARGVAARPAAPVIMAEVLAALASTYARATRLRRVAAIGRAHRMARQPWSPAHLAIRDTLARIAHPHDTPARRAVVIGTAEVRRLVATCRTGLCGQSDRGLLLLGFAAVPRRSELVAVHRGHLTLTPAGLCRLIPRAKGDQEGREVELGLPNGARAETCQGAP